MTRHNAELNHQRDKQHANAVNHALTTNNTLGTASLNEHCHYHDPADAQLLRGIPAVGGRGSIGGHIAGTRPDHWQPDERKQKHRKL